MKPFYSLRRWPTWTKVIGVIAVIGILRFIVGDPAPRVSVPVQAPEAKPAKNLGQIVYGSSLRGYTEANGKILVAYDILSAERGSVEREVVRFMRELAKTKRTDWNEVTISGYAQFTNKATGERKMDVAYTITFDRSAVERVVDWDRVDVRMVGLVEFAIPSLR